MTLDPTKPQVSVSPFDGANRIRFKGSLPIAEFRLRNSDDFLQSAIRILQSAIGRLSAAARLPRKLQIVCTVYYNDE